MLPLMVVLLRGMRSRNKWSCAQNLVGAQGMALSFLQLVKSQLCSRDFPGILHLSHHTHHSPPCPMPQEVIILNCISRYTCPLACGLVKEGTGRRMEDERRVR